MSSGELRQKQEVEVWVRGKWVRTKAFVNPNDICQYPGCIRKLPNVNSSKSASRRGCRGGYCSKACYWKHKQKLHLKKPLNNYV